MTLSVLQQITASRVPAAPTPATTTEAPSQTLTSGLFKQPITPPPRPDVSFGYGTASSERHRLEGLFSVTRPDISSAMEERLTATTAEIRATERPSPATPTAPPQPIPAEISITNLRSFLTSQNELLNSFAVETPAAAAVAQGVAQVAEERAINQDTSGLRAIFANARSAARREDIPDITEAAAPTVPVVNTVVERNGQASDNEIRVVSLFGGQVSVRG